MTVTAGASSPPSGVPGAADEPATQAFAQQHPAPARPMPSEACPLCGAPLDPQQDWCLNCGAAARTRLAATPNWKAPIAVIAVIAALALGVLAAALVKLAGGSGASATPVTTTVTAAPTASAPAATPGLPTTTTAATAPGAVTPGATTATVPTVTAQPSGAGGIAGSSTTPTVTAKSGTSPKNLSHLSPRQRRKVEELIGASGRKGAGR